MGPTIGAIISLRSGSSGAGYAIINSHFGTAKEISAASTISNTIVNMKT